MTVSKTEPEILNDIHAKLSQIYDLLYSVVNRAEKQEETPIAVDPSKGSCPACGSINVHLGSIDTGTGGHNPMYKCNDCEVVWVNDESAIRQH